MIKEKIKIDDLYFGMMCSPMSYSGKSPRARLEQYNLFGSSRVKRSVAMWVLMDDEERKEHDFLSWCFMDVRGRCEYEYIVCSWPYPDDAKVEDVGEKFDMYELYVKPNKELLFDLVSRVTKSSAKKYLAEERKRYER